MLENIPSLLSIGFIFFKLLILAFNVCFGRLSSVFHAFCDLTILLSISSCCCWLLSCCILLLTCCISFTFFSSCCSVCLSWCCTWLSWLLTRSMNILDLTWVRLLLLLLHFGFVFINLYLNNWIFIELIELKSEICSFNLFNFQI